MPSFHWPPYFEEVFSLQWCQLIAILAVQITRAFKATHTSNNLSGDGDWRSGVQKFNSGVTFNNSCITGLLVNPDGDRHRQTSRPCRAACLLWVWRQMVDNCSFWIPSFHWPPYFEDVFSLQGCQLIAILAVQFTYAFNGTHTSNDLTGDSDWRARV